jgi:hypothetical protein
MVDNNETDIALIGKYLNGELDARAMHRLEKRAQSDPFLMDAMSGYEKAGNDQREQLNALAESLRQRISPQKKERKIIPWRYISIAASVLVVISVGGVLLFNNHPESRKEKLTSNVLPVVKPEDIVLNKPNVDTIKKTGTNAAIVTAPKPASPSKQVLKPAANAKADHLAADKQVTAEQPAAVSADAMVAEVKPVAKDTAMPLNEMVVMGMASANQDKAKSQYKRKVPAKKDTVPNTLLQANVPGVIVNKAEGTGAKNGSMLASSGYSNLLQGRVLAQDNGMPVPGASVMIAGTTKIAVTDKDGKFSIPADTTKKDKLVIASVGYTTREVSARNNRSIELSPATNSLNEVVVTHNDSLKKAAANDIKAHPVEGWDSLKKYLKDNAASPDGQTGTVKLSFMVDQSGAITNITIISGLSNATNNKAINLIANGPVWAGNANGLPEKVTLKIKFSR